MPYVCKGEYDGGPFLTYLTRRKDLNVSVPQVAEDWIDYTWIRTMPLVQLEDLIQTWLFFGLLTEVFGDLFIPSHYVRTVVPTDPSLGTTVSITTGDEKVLDTSQLLPVVNIWMRRIQSSANPECSPRTEYGHIAACLNLTSKTLRAIMFHTRAESCNPWILCAIASIGELLELAANHAYGIKDQSKDNLCPRTWRLRYDEAQSDFQTKSDHICSYEIY